MAKITIVNEPDTLQNPAPDQTILLAAKGGSIVFIGSVFGYGSQFLIGILLTRFLGADLYGQYKVAVTAGEIAAGIALLGLDYAMVRFIALFTSRRDTPGVWGTIQFGTALVTLSSILIGVGLFAFARPLALYVFHSPQIISLLRLASLIIPFSALTSVLGAATMGFNKMQYNASARQIAQPSIRLVALLLLVFLGFTAGRALGAYIIGLIVSSLMLFYFLNRLFPLRRPINTARHETRDIIVFSIPAYFSNLIRTFGPSLQTVLLGSLNTMATVGIFAVANQVSTASTLFNQSIGTAADPIISELHGLGDNKQLAHFYQITAKWMFMANLPMFIVVLLLSKPILTIFGTEFIVGSTALTILALSNLVIAAAGISDGVLAMTGNTPVKLINSVVQTILSIGLCILLIPKWGALGAALAVLISFTVIHVILVIEVYMLFRMLPYTLGFFKPLVAGLIALPIGWFISHFFLSGTNFFLAIVNGLIIMVIYIGVILLLGLSPEDRSVLNHLTKRITATFSKK